LSDEDLRRLCTLEQLNWGILNESVVRWLLVLRNEVEEQRKKIANDSRNPGRTAVVPQESELINSIFV
jgi:hypothetical protein